MGWFILGILGVQLVILVQNLVYWKFRPQPETASETEISVLIPARNERDNLPSLLAALSRQDRHAAEVIVCDDNSGDGTTKWLEENADRFGATWFRADPKPEGWFGKCWACQLLGERARGDWLLFLDADLEPGPNLLEVLGGEMAATSAAMITGIPGQRATTIGDGLLQAMVPFSVFTTLPLRFAEFNKNPAFAFADGQIIAFRRGDYADLQPHQQVRNHVLEDVELARTMKRLGKTVRIVDATRIATVRMYQSASEALNGFSKNAVSICGGRVWSALAIAAIMILLYLMPLGMIATGTWWAYPAVALSAGLFAGACRVVRLPVWYGLLYPVAIALAIVVIGRSVIWHWRGSVQWKGRTYQVR